MIAPSSTLSAPAPANSSPIVPKKSYPIVHKKSYPIASEKATPSVHNERREISANFCPNLPTCCKYCSSQNLAIAEGRGIHAAQVRCVDCDRHIKWISKSLAADLGILHSPAPP